MHTAEKLPSFNNKGLPYHCVLPQLKTLFIQEATKQAGKSVYEILGIVELMRVAYEKGEIESLQQRLSMLLSDAADLSIRLSNILDLSRLLTETSNPAFTEFDIVAILQQVAESSRNFIGQKPVRIMDVTAPGPLAVRSNSEVVRLIVTELMHNAAKFTDRGRVALILNSDKESVTVTVTDTGRGMSRQEIAAFLYEDGREFLGEARPETRGSGLRIVRHLVTSLGEQYRSRAGLGKERSSR